MLSFLRTGPLAALFECGFRPHEVLSIRACDVVDGRGRAEAGSGGKDTGGHPRDLAWVHLPAANPVTPSGRNKTGARVVPVRASARRLLDARDATRAVAGADGRIFPWGHRHLTVTFSRMKAAHATGHGAPSGDGAAATASSHRTPSFQGRLYDLRHSAITTLYLAAVPDQVIRKVVGWTPSSRMPDVYVHVTQAHIQRAFEHLDVPGALPVHQPPPPPATVTGPGARQARPPGWY